MADRKATREESERLREFLRNGLKDRGTNINQIARSLDRSPSLFYNFLREETQSLSAPVVNGIARVLGVPVDTLYGRGSDPWEGRRLRVEYTVGLFGKAFPVGAQQPAIYVDCPANVSQETHFALQVEGDSMLPIPDGWTFVCRREPVDPFEMIGKLCAVDVQGERGKSLFLRTIGKGSVPGLYNLTGWNVSAMEDAQIRRCYLVELIQQPVEK